MIGRRLLEVTPLPLVSPISFNRATAASSSRNSFAGAGRPRTATSSAARSPSSSPRSFPTATCSSPARSDRRHAQRRRAGHLRAGRRMIDATTSSRRRRSPTPGSTSAAAAPTPPPGVAQPASSKRSAVRVNGVLIRTPMHPIRILARLAVSLLLASAARWWPAAAQAARIKEVASVAGRPHQPADRLRPRRRPRRHRRRQPFAVRDAGLPAMLAAMGFTLPPGVNPELKNARRGDDHRGAARLRQARPDDRRHRLGDRQGQEPARRHADHDPAQGRRRPGLRDGAGQPRRSAAPARRRPDRRCRSTPERGRIPDGATVERSVATPIADGDSIQSSTSHSR